MFRRTKVHLSGPPSRSPRGVLVGAVAALAVLAGPGAASAMADGGGALYTQTNDPAGNVVQKFDRSRDGKLTPAGTFSTGGAGLADLGGRQGAIELSEDEDTVYATNAGSNTVSVFRVRDHDDDDDDDDRRGRHSRGDDDDDDGKGHHSRDDLELIGTFPSGGVAPLSVDEQDGRVYVLNSGGTPNVTAFSTARRGALWPIPGGTRELPGADGAAQVSVTPDGRRLVVSERLSNRLETLALDRFGRPGAPVITASSGTTPFGFAISHRGHVIVSEAGTNSASSYRIGSGGLLGVITPALALNQGGVCWVAVSPDGRYAYTGNAGGTISGLAVDRDGSLTALDADGVTAVPRQSPRDLDFTSNGRFVYAVSPGNATDGGSVTGYRVARDGSLTEITSAPAAADITGAAVD
jgi:6-phosphogluconolactonase